MKKRKKRKLHRRYGHARKTGVRMKSARSLKIGDIIRAPSSTGLSMGEAKIVEKRPASRHFSRGKAFDLILTYDGTAHTHPSDQGQTWRVYALGEDKFEVIK